MIAAYTFCPRTTIKVRIVAKETSQIRAKKINRYPPIMLSIFSSISITKTFFHPEDQKRYTRVKNELALSIITHCAYLNNETPASRREFLLAFLS
jgi:hypothetical protein